MQSVKWALAEKLKFILSYAYYKARLLIDVRSPKLRFFLFELRYSLVNLANTIRSGTFAQVAYSGPDLIETRSGIYRVRTDSQDAAIVSPAFERQDMIYLAKVLREEFPEDSGLLDIGANIGVYAIQVALQSNLKIWAFEPIADNRRILAENIRLNSLSEERVKVLPFALGNANDLVSMHYRKAFPGHASTETSDASDAEVIQVERRRADDLNLVLPRRLLIKIDVEGHELEVLAGMSKTITDAELVWICIEDVTNRERIYEALARLGFECQAKVTPYNSWWRRPKP